MSDPLDPVQIYHQRTKHHFHAYARSLGYLDWATQPDPFRRYRGAPVIELDKTPPGDTPLYEAAFVAGYVPPTPLNRRSISQLFFDSLAISAWKRSGDASWALRVNPSSGNLHPTEGYLVCGPVEGLCDAPLVCHYAPQEHVLEQRAQFPLKTWQTLSASLPQNTVLVGLASVHWREVWKYGERAFRYCQHDVGHAIATISLASASLGWEVALLDDVGAEELAGLLGLFDFRGAEAEHPDCVLAVYPQSQACPTRALPADALQAFYELAWQGRPNQLSPGHVPWPIINDVAAATTKPPTQLYTHSGQESAVGGEPLARSTPLSLRRIIHQRRSAVAMDGVTGIPRDVFYKILRKTLPRPDRFPFNALPWRPHVHLALFVHRVYDLPPSLYLLVRDPAQKVSLQSALRADFAWERPAACPADLGLYQLTRGDVRLVSQQLSCHQEIASDGCFSLSMLAEFEAPLERLGPWFYPRLFWECGMIGQVLYLEAEAAGVRGTGIGCFFDDAVHELLGLKDAQYQSLYHFTLGGPLEAPRLTTLPAYPAS